MTGLTLATLLHASMAAIGANQTDSYAAAHRATCQTGKPLVVMVGAPWCAPCRQMKRTILPQCKKQGVFKRVTFALVNADREQKLAQKLIRGGPIPQLIMYRRTAGGWKRRKLIGGQSVATVEKFVNEGIALDEADKKVSAEEKARQQKQTTQPAARPEVRTVSTP